MLDLLPVLIPIALVDSASITPLGLVPLTTILAGRRPYQTALAFLAGLFVSYLLMGLAFLFGLSTVFMRLNAWIGHRWNNPEPADFGLELLLGVVLVVVGFRIADRRRVRQQERNLDAGVTPGAAFGFGFMLNVVGFPGALPFFAFADQILRADPPAQSTVLLMAVYAAIFVLPLTVMVLLRVLLGSRGDALMLGIKGFFDIWGRRLLIVLLLALGVALTVDAALYFLRGVPLVPIGWPSA